MLRVAQGIANSFHGGSRRSLAPPSILSMLAVPTHCLPQSWRQLHLPGCGHRGQGQHSGVPNQHGQEASARHEHTTLVEPQPGRAPTPRGTQAQGRGTPGTYQRQCVVRGPVSSVLCTLPGTRPRRHRGYQAQVASTKNTQQMCVGSHKVQATQAYVCEGRGRLCMQHGRPGWMMVRRLGATG